MAAGDLTVTVVGSYSTMAEAVVALTAVNDAAVTDHHDLYILPSNASGGLPFVVLKYVRAAA